MARSSHEYQAGEDLIDRLLGIQSGDALADVRARRADIAGYTQGSYAALLQPPEPHGLSLADRQRVALRVAELSGSALAADYYRQRLNELGANSQPASEREHAIVQYAERMTLSPHTTGAADLQALQAAGLATRDCVSLAQLITFVAYQVRVLAGLQLLGGRIARSLRPPAELQRHGGFTLEAVDWHAYLPIVDPATATAEQLAVLDESSPEGRTSQYWRLLVHDVDALRQRSGLFKAVMYAPGGLARADRELATVAVSLVNGCVYCASVHSRRYAQLTKRPETMQRLFDEGLGAELEARERAIVDFAVALSRDGSGATVSIAPLRALGMSDHELLDLVHATAMFSWANRLLQTLGAVVYPSQS